jgi:hypothetical protein
MPDCNGASLGGRCHPSDEEDDDGVESVGDDDGDDDDVPAFAWRISSDPLYVQHPTWSLFQRIIDNSSEPTNLRVRQIVIHNGRSEEDSLRGPEGEAAETAVPAIRCVDEVALTRLFSFVNHLHLRHGFLINGGGGYGGGPSAFIDVYTSEAVFQIGLASYGFDLGCSTNADTVFFSPKLARFCDDVVFMATGRHLPEALAHAVSGEKWMLNDRMSYGIELSSKNLSNADSDSRAK